MYSLDTPSVKHRSARGRANGDRITHRIAITTLADIDDEVKRLLQRAYEMDG